MRLWPVHLPVTKPAWVLGALAVAGMAHPTVAIDSTPNYYRDIKPLLQERCVSCHGQLKQKGDLRLDAGTLIVKGGEGGPAIKKGAATHSLLMERITAATEDERMPPEGKPLSAAQIDLLSRWIEAGAPFPADEPVASSPAEHWAFQPVRRPAVAKVQNSAWVRNPIDGFVLAKLEQRGWQPAPVATASALVRRMYLDLTGLPPDPGVVQLLTRTHDPATLDALVDRLLSDPAHGERWGRHWLDVVRYADSNGYELDAEKPFVWRYRDYVIDALNSDKPYDQFIVEQLAGDELTDRSAATMIATSYLRLGHWDAEPADADTDRFDQLDDIVSTTGQTFLGLTIGCARCHDHKFEPLTTRDYYSLISIFNPLQRPRKGRVELALPVGSPADVSATVAEGKDDRPKAYIWEEPSAQPPLTHVLLRGAPARLGDQVEPAVPAILASMQPKFPASASTTRRRLGLAQWLTREDNALTARVIVNRVWQQHFGAGLVRTPNDFGLMGDPPTHPELLDWLAHWFVHDAQGSLKRLHRLILTSNTWRMSKTSPQDYAQQDPENRLLWRMPYRRLEIEAIRDGMLAASGQLNRKSFGPAMKPRVPLAALEANTDKTKIWKADGASESSRRTIYAFVKRGLVVPMLEVMDFADTVSSCPQRQVTTVAPQAMSLFNGEFVNQQAQHFAARLRREAGGDFEKQVRLAWQLTLARDPTPAEMQKARAAREGGLSLEQFCRVILNLNEFVYPE